MDALILTGKHQIHIGSFPEPPMDDNSVKVAVSYCGICGTDLHKFGGRSGSRPLKLPVPLGHEISGVVESVGRNVRAFRPGDRVTVDPNWSCGACDACKNGTRHLCENSRGVVKGMADFICPPQENVYRIPDELSLRDAALAEPLSCCLHGMDLLDVKLGETVAIVGFGAIGSIMLQLCKLASAANIIVIETNQQKREKALAMGATLFVNPSSQDPAKAIAEAGIKNVDKVMECVGLPVTVTTALQVAGKCARVVIFGVGDPEKPVCFNYYEAMLKELDIRMSFLNPCTTDRAVRLLAAGAVNAEEIISKVISPQEALGEFEEQTFIRKGKVLVKWKEME